MLIMRMIIADQYNGLFSILLLATNVFSSVKCLTMEFVASICESSVSFRLSFASALSSEMAQSVTRAS